MAQKAVCGIGLLEDGREIIRREAAAVAGLADDLGQGFSDAVEMIYSCRGSVVLSGIGKAGIIGEKISATLASTGTPSYFLHAAEAVHGDLGRLRRDDIVVVLSNSGKSEEVVRLISLIKKLSVKMIGITGGDDSPLAEHSDVYVPLGKIDEVCPLGLAPSASTTCMLAIGDALALTVMKKRNFQADDYAKYHPGGALGRKLITVEQAALFSPGKALPQASDSCTVQEALQEARKKTEMRAGCVLLVDSDGKLSGLLTDGDLRRAVEGRGTEIHNMAVADVMTRTPQVVRPDTLAGEAMALFHEWRIDELPVVDDQGRPVGLIDVQDILALKVVQ